MPRLSETSGAQQRKNTDYAPLVENLRGSTEKKHGLRPACRKLPGLNREKTRITPRSTEKKHGFRPACRNLPGLNREKM